MLNIPYSPARVANSFLALANKNNATITQMQIQSLIYLAQGWCLALKNKPLINEALLAWRFGTISTSIFHEFKHFGNGAIKSPMLELLVEKGNARWHHTTISDTDKFTMNLLAEIWESYSDYQTDELTQMTCCAKSPWQKIYKIGEKEGIVFGKEVPNCDIKEFFLSNLATKTPQIPLLENSPAT
jgi:uncharacterized phage-associated protein